MKPDVRPRAGCDVKTAARWQASEYRKPTHSSCLLACLSCLPCLPCLPCLACLLCLPACLFAYYANNFRPPPHPLSSVYTTLGLYSYPSFLLLSSMLVVVSLLLFPFLLLPFLYASIYTEWCFVTRGTHLGRQLIVRLRIMKKQSHINIYVLSVFVYEI